MRTRANHIEKGSDTIEGTANEQNAPLRSELSLTIALWEMRLDGEDTLVNETFTSKTHVHQRYIQLLGYVAVGAGDDTSDFLNVRSHERVSTSWITCQNDRILISAVLHAVEEGQLWQLLGLVGALLSQVGLELLVVPFLSGFVEWASHVLGHIARARLGLDFAFNL